MKREIIAMICGVSLLLSACGASSNVDATPVSELLDTSPAQSLQEEPIQTADSNENPSPTPTTEPFVTPEPLPSPSPSPTPKPSPTPTPKPTDEDLLKKTAQDLRQHFRFIDGVISSEIEYEDYREPMSFSFSTTPALTVRFEIDPEVFPPEAFQNYVCGILEKIDEYYSQMQGAARIIISVSYPQDANPRLSWSRSASDDSIYDGALTYATDDGKNTVAINAYYISYCLGLDEMTEITPVNPPACSYDEYLAIEDGMSYSQVVEIIGSDGTEMSSASAGGSTAKVYQWDGDKRYSNVVIEFMNDAVISKAQAGLD